MTVILPSCCGSDVPPHPTMTCLEEDSKVDPPYIPSANELIGEPPPLDKQGTQENVYSKMTGSFATIGELEDAKPLSSSGHPECSHCRYFDPHGTNAGETGYCRALSPAERHRPHWPSVGKKDWCGEFEHA